MFFFNKTEFRASFPVGGAVAVINPGDNALNICGCQNGAGEVPAVAIGQEKSDTG